jgi:hypothetical protein
MGADSNSARQRDRFRQHGHPSTSVSSPVDWQADVRDNQATWRSTLRRRNGLEIVVGLGFCDDRFGAETARPVARPLRTEVGRPESAQPAA